MPDDLGFKLLFGLVQVIAGIMTCFAVAGWMIAALFRGIKAIWVAVKTPRLAEIPDKR